MFARRAHSRGFTLIEMMVVVAIVLIVSTLAVVGLSRARPRANLSTTSTELYALFRNARTNAMSTGRTTIVMVFPNFANPRGGIGRVIAFEDANAAFFLSATTPNFSTFAPATYNPGSDSEILASLDFPPGVVIGGRMQTNPGLPFSAVDTTVDCGFCMTGGDRRGAVVYDSRGRATFRNAIGAALDVWGASLSMRILSASDSVGALDPGATTTRTSVLGTTKTLILTSTTGGVKSFSTGG